MIYIDKKYKKLKKNKGFSLIELMVVVGILSFIVIGGVSFFTGGARSWISGQSQLKAQREARMAMDIMVREIREGKSVDAGSDEDDIIVSFPNDLANWPIGNVTFKLIGNSVKRNTVTLIDNIPEGGLVFTYFDDQENEAGNPTQASKIKIELKVDVDGDTKPDIILETEVNLRNYGLTG
jgi:prepilin-type N-terminal cleavage/methylation domain-containing protein